MKTITILLTLAISACADQSLIDFDKPIRIAAKTGGFELDGDFYSCRLVESMSMRQWLDRYGKAR